MTISAGLSRFANNPTTTLNMPGNLAIGAVTMIVTNNLGFPNPGPFYVLMDSEIIQVTGGTSGTTWNIKKGTQGTADVSHNNGVPIVQLLTAFELNGFRQEFNVMSYGAKGDGSSDDSTPFQNAINDAHALAGGGVVFLPSFTYLISSTLTSYSNVVFVTYGATITGGGAASVTPLVKWSLVGGLSVPGALIASNGATVANSLSVSGGLSITSGTSTLSGSLIVNNSETISPPSQSVAAETPVLSVGGNFQTLTVTAGYSNQRSVIFTPPLLTASSPVTIGSAATLAIVGPPTPISNVTITNPYALWIQAGASHFDGSIQLNGTLTMLQTASQIVPGTTSFSIRNNGNGRDNLLVANGGDVTAFRNLLHSTQYRMRAHQSSAQSVPNATWTPITNMVDNTADDYDVFSSFTSNTYTVPITGKYDIRGRVAFASVGAAGTRVGARIIKNSGTVIAVQLMAAVSAGLQTASPIASDIVQLTAGDTLVLQGYQDSGSNNNTLPSDAYNGVWLTVNYTGT